MRLGIPKYLSFRISFFCYNSIMIRKKRAVESDKEGDIRIYPSLHETPKKSRIKRLLMLLKRMKKGH